MPQVAVSILNFNSACSTLACVKSLQSAAQVASEQYVLKIYVADNASRSDDQRLLQQLLEEPVSIDLRINSENLGFAAGHNRNLRAIFKHSVPDFVWLLNSDCLPDGKTLSALLECARQNPEVGIWGATLIEPNGQTIRCAGGCFYNTWISSYRQYGRGMPVSQVDQLELVNYSYIDGASMFFPVAVLQNGLQALSGVSKKSGAQQSHWLNETFFLYFEELDLIKRLKPGIEIAWCKDARIIHAGGVSAGTSANRRSGLAEYHSTLSALKFTRMYYPRRLWVVVVARYLSKSLLLLIRGDFRLIRSLTRAYRDFLLE